MTALTLLDKAGWDPSLLPEKPYVTVGLLIAALSKADPDAWVCTEGGALTTVVYEPGANEPFVILTHTPVKTDLAVPSKKNAGGAR